MSTRCLIGIEYDDKTIRYIYCHHDGYLAGVGKTLQEDYKDIEKIEKLLNLGDMSSLGSNPEVNTATDLVDVCKRWFLDPSEINKSLVAEVLKLSEYYCDIYGDSPARVVEDREQYMKEQNDADYRYLFTDGKWLVQPWSKDEFSEYSAPYNEEDE